MGWTLTIGNKAYSSWSLRPWMVLRQFGIPFVEEVVPLYTEATTVELQRRSPTGKVPLLAADGALVWESLAIIEFIADRRPDLAIWPRDHVARAQARSLASEMHAGFMALRKACPTNFRRAPKPLAFADDVRRDVARIEAAWAAAREQWGEGGPFLFGSFSAVDAMFAPVVNRFEAYAVDVRPDTRTYMAAITSTSSWQAWIAGAQAETWVIDRFEGL